MPSSECENVSEYVTAQSPATPVLKVQSSWCLMESVIPLPPELCGHPGLRLSSPYNLVNDGERRGEGRELGTTWRPSELKALSLGAPSHLLTLGIDLHSPLLPGPLREALSRSTFPTLEKSE